MVTALAGMLQMSARHKTLAFGFAHVYQHMRILSIISHKHIRTGAAATFASSVSWRHVALMFSWPCSHAALPSGMHVVHGLLGPALPCRTPPQQRGHTL